MGTYQNYYKAQGDAKANPTGFASASAAISQALKDGGYPQEWLQPTLELVARESSFNSAAQNPNSTAQGLYQFLDSTRKNYGGDSVDWSSPYNQAVAGLKYISDRYSNPVKALQFWDKNKAAGNAWY